uniref:Uncharacterized protein n=2 Tax=Graphocephala atropunctata TaxID=36148 RepID=A0A1B6LFU9_9HEMI
MTMAIPLSSTAIVAAEPSCTIVSEFSPQQVSFISSHSQIQGLRDKFSQEDIFGFICQELDEKAAMLKPLGELYSKDVKRVNNSQSRSFSKSYNEEYSDILHRKGCSHEKLTEAVENSNPNGIPKYKLHAYHELCSKLIHCRNEAHQELQQQKEKIKKSKNDSQRLNTYICLLSNQEEEESGDQESEDTAQSRVMFQEAKQDMITTITTLCPDEKVRMELLSTLEILLKAYMNNLDNTSQQYVELSPHAIYHESIQNLMEGGVIIPHPLSPVLFRLCVE